MGAFCENLHILIFAKMISSKINISFSQNGAKGSGTYHHWTVGIERPSLLTPAPLSLLSPSSAPFDLVPPLSWLILSHRVESTFFAKIFVFSPKCVLLPKSEKKRSCFAPRTSVCRSALRYTQENLSWEEHNIALWSNLFGSTMGAFV